MVRDRSAYAQGRLIEEKVEAGSAELPLQQRVAEDSPRMLGRAGTCALREAGMGSALQACDATSDYNPHCDAEHCVVLG